MTSPLAIRLCNWIGDVIFGLPALQLLSDRGFDLHLYGKGWAPTLLSGTPWPVTVRQPRLRERVTQLRALHARLRATTSSTGRVQALVMPNSFSSALDLRLANFKVCGFARDGRSLLLTRRIPEASGPHAVESFWQLACALTGDQAPPPQRLHLPLSEAAHTLARAVIHQHTGGEPFVCVAPFAASAVFHLSKKWPDFPALVEALVRQGLPVLICPGPGDELTEARERYPQARIVENLPLDAYAALLARSRLVVANDTGPGHMAAAVGAPLISVLGPTLIERWRPWGPTVQILSAQPGWPTLEQVLIATRSRLDGA